MAGDQSSTYLECVAAGNGKARHTAEIRSIAAARAKRALAAVRRIDEPWHVQETWKGSREALIAAGVCTTEHFPAAPKRTTWGNAGRPDFWHTRRVKGKLYEHSRPKTRDEDSVPGRSTGAKSSEDFRAQIRAGAHVLLHLVKNHAGPFGLEQSAYERVVALHSELLSIADTAPICRRNASVLQLAMDDGQCRKGVGMYVGESIDRVL